MGFPCRFRREEERFYTDLIFSILILERREIQSAITFVGELEDQAH